MGAHTPKRWKGFLATLIGTQDDLSLSDLFDQTPFIGGRWADICHVRLLCDYVQGHGVKAESGLCLDVGDTALATAFSSCLRGNPRVQTTTRDTDVPASDRLLFWDGTAQDTSLTRSFDLIYSNSWDQFAWNADIAELWLDMLRPGGVLLLDLAKPPGGARIADAQTPGPCEAVFSYFENQAQHAGRILGTVAHQSLRSDLAAYDEVQIMTLAFRKRFEN